MNVPLAQAKRLDPDKTDLASFILPNTVRLERVSERRELSIDEAILDERRDPRDRVGLAGERLVTSLIERYAPLNPNRLLCWDTVVQRANVIEIDGVSATNGVFLEIKWTVNPERVFAICARQLLQAAEIYQLSGEKAPRTIGVVVDCGPVVGKPAYRETNTVAELVQMIESGTSAFSLCVLPYEELADFISAPACSALLSREELRAALSR